MVTCGDFQQPNIMTAAWTGIVCSDPPMAYVSVRRERLSHALISRTGTFALNLTTKELVKAADFCGVKSGREVDKTKHLGLSGFAGLQFVPPSRPESRLARVLRGEKARAGGARHVPA